MRNALRTAERLKWLKKSAAHVRRDWPSSAEYACWHAKCAINVADPPFDSLNMLTLPYNAPPSQRLLSYLH